MAIECAWQRGQRHGADNDSTTIWGMYRPMDAHYYESSRYPVIRGSSTRVAINHARFRGADRRPSQHSRVFWNL